MSAPSLKRIAILQSNYIPWKGYFDVINLVDEFIILDEVQFTKNDWRNRNKIKTKAGVDWLSIPVRQEHLHQKIIETRVVDERWATKHWKTLSQSYARAWHFKTYADYIEKIYREASAFEFLSQINRCFIRAIMEL
ncbi:MAG: WbqC family protein, partial [Nitrososphaera sp.]|nr:WbqC family protein [Nitrososphaera sp.]